MWILIYLVLSLIFYILIGKFLWKRFDYFQMTFFKQAAMTGFQYDLKRIAFAWVSPLLGILIFWSFVQDYKNKHPDAPMESSASQDSSTSNAPSNPEPPAVGQNPPTENAQNNESKKADAPYDGDDPVIRARMGLPPKN